MTVNDLPENRRQLDKVERALLGSRRDWLLRRLGSKAVGLRVWAFGLGWESRKVEEIPVSKIEEFSAKFLHA